MIKYWKSIIYKFLSHQFISAYTTNSKMEKSLKSKLQERITHITSTIITYANNTELSKNIQFEKKEYLKKNPNTFLVMAGDFLSPSVYNSLQYLGQRIRGKQMVEVMTVAGTNLAIFGNHEFDITENELQDRINESQFDWVSSNTFHVQNRKIIPFEKHQGTEVTPFPDKYIMRLKINK